MWKGEDHAAPSVHSHEPLAAERAAEAEVQLTFCEREMRKERRDPTVRDDRPE